ncbi:ferrous iron transporter B [Arcanobacterium haemolyticum]|nr:ferrous iron transporter B [Arcanobacterium haemolyticum]
MSCPNCGPSSAPASPVLTLDPSKKEPTIVLVGNPNVGKSTIFNHVTGARQKVVNAPGTTVQVMAGRWKSLGARILDLPGTYSLIPTSPDEEVVTETVSSAPGSMTDPAAGQSIDLILAVLDGGSMTRSLYLLAQIAQTGQPVAAVVTMADVAQQNDEPVDTTKLAALLGIPVMVIDPRTSGQYGLLDDMVRTAIRTRPRVIGIAPDPDAPGYSATAAAEVTGCESGIPGPCTCHLPVSPTHVLDVHGGDDMERAAGIFGWVDAIEQDIRPREGATGNFSRSDKLDRVLLNPVAGTLIFFGLLWLLFMLAGTWVGPLQDWFDARFSSTDDGAISLANGLAWCLGQVGLADTWVHSLLVNGLATGLGVVASFFPLMFVIYAAFSVLEDSGYMARVAFLGDRLMRKIGLDGRVILPLIMGFGCNLPSLAAARTIPSARQRLVTVLITPYTSCAARLAIYLMIAKVFFPGSAGTVVWAMYVMSLILIVLGAWVLKRFITRDEAAAPLMLVLPAYQVPRLLVMAKSTWTRAWTFVTGAGKIIVLMTMVVWLMSAIPVGSNSEGSSFADPELAMEDSLYGATARVLEPVFAPTGFGEWHMTGALMTGFVAKETVVSSIVTSYNMDPEAAGDAEDGGSDLGELPGLLHASLEKSAGPGYEQIAAIAFLVFVLAYTPCMATVAEQAKLIGGKRTALAVLVQLVVAWVLAVGIFQIGSLFV